MLLRGGGLPDDAKKPGISRCYRSQATNLNSEKSRDMGSCISAGDEQCCRGGALPGSDQVHVMTCRGDLSCDMAGLRSGSRTPRLTIKLLRRTGMIAEADRQITGTRKLSAYM